ncbi:ATP-grasp ribosomal peptide maturase [Actinomadura rubrisoli]|uniref:ATP-grasp ribosomal peptide maturase n=1 Tax=Actinomadura rubrisoli TaxID=2530368 RepID=A0A4R5BQR6_9ACTN|nr:ATP-grasp ribosomal peptide maturase [Actinomadura rubrisoli]TDD86412.1 ATP-grasp ribosomal peptide maturase [Actinomadura rubrisoli]
MNRPGAVLVLTHWFDPTADHVVEELNRRGVSVFRFDTADFPRRLTFTGRLDSDSPWRGALRLGNGRTLDLQGIGGAYFRRPTLFGFGEMDPTERAWATAEARAGLGGLLMASDRWLNHPHHSGYAAYKPMQLAEASSAGLLIPATLITSDPAEARDFAADVGEVIYKPLTHARPGDGRTLYASVVAPGDLDGQDAAGVAGTAHLFQERIKHDHAVRLTVIDGRMFAAALHARSPAAELDWRSDYDAVTYEPAEVPGPVRRGVMALMDALRLRFGAFDFLVCPDRGWVFLEVNPNGQWAWIEQATGQPIAAAIADALTREETMT